MSSEMSDEARTRLMNALPAMVLAVGVAKVKNPGAKIKIAIVAENPDKSGRITATFDGEEFFNDVIKVLGYKELQELLEAKYKKE